MAQSGRRLGLALPQDVGHLLLIGDEAGAADAEVDVQQVAPLDDGLGAVVERLGAAPLQVERRGEVELEALPLPLRRDPVVDVHQRRAAGRDDLVRERPAQDVERGCACLLHDRLLGWRPRRDILDEQRLGRDQAIAIRRADGVDQVILQLGRQSVRHADRARLVDRDAPRVPGGDPLLEVRREPFLAVQDALVVEGRQVIAQVGAEGRGLQAAVARVTEEIGVAVAVPAGDAVAAEQLQRRVGRVLAAEDDPEVDLVGAHQRKEMLAHLLRLDRPLALDPLPNEFRRGLGAGRDRRVEDGAERQRNEAEKPAASHINKNASCA